MCNDIDDDTPRTEYEHEVKVFKISNEAEDFAYYVADDMIDALREHLNLQMDGDPRELTIQEIRADQSLTRTESEGIMEDFPPCFERIPDLTAYSRGPKVKATSADWAYFYKDQKPYQIMSSEF